MNWVVRFRYPYRFSGYPRFVRCTRRVVIENPVALVGSSGVQLSSLFKVNVVPARWKFNNNFTRIPHIKAQQFKIRIDKAQFGLLLVRTNARLVLVLRAHISLVSRKVNRSFELLADCYRSLEAPSVHARLIRVPMDALRKRTTLQSRDVPLNTSLTEVHSQRGAHHSWRCTESAVAAALEH